MGIDSNSRDDLRAAVLEPVTFTVDVERRFDNLIERMVVREHRAGATAAAPERKPASREMLELELRSIRATMGTRRYDERASKRYLELLRVLGHQ